MKHGADIYRYSKKIKCKEDEIIDFSSNINFYTPQTNIKLTPELLAKYPDSRYKKLKKAISKNHHIKRSQIKLYNGATTAIFELIKSLKQKRIYLYAPLYGEYEKAAKNKQIIKINRFDNLYKKVKPNSIVVFVNPSTPDGRYYDLDKLFGMWSEQNCTIICDESFLEFENLKSLQTQIKSYKKLYIIQSFSKFYSCAGVRIGAVFSQKENIKKLKTPLWNLSAFDVEFLTKKLQNKGFEKRTKKLHKKQKQQLYNILYSSNLFDKIYKSDTNFILTKSKKSKQIFNHLLKHKILSRKCGSFDFLSDDYLRFGVKNTNKHNKLKKALDEIS